MKTLIHLKTFTAHRGVFAYPPVVGDSGTLNQDVQGSTITQRQDGDLWVSYQDTVRGYTFVSALDRYNLVIPKPWRDWCSNLPPKGSV